MSIIAGAVGSKAVFPDGAQIDHLSENTVGHGVRVRGISDPTTYPVIAGDVGESAVAGTSQTTGTGGSVYQKSTTTAPGSGTASEVNFLVLNKGVYLLSCFVNAYSNATGNLTANIRMTGQITPDQIQYNGANVANCVTIAAVPITITADSTRVSVFAKWDSGTVISLGNTMWAARIA